MFKKIIKYLHKRYCEKPEIKNLYLGGIQRDFGKILSENEVRERNIVVYNFIQSGWFEQIFNEELKPYVEFLFSTCETQKQRDFMHHSINILLKLEAKLQSYGTQPEGKVEFDKYNLNQ